MGKTLESGLERTISSLVTLAVPVLLCVGVIRLLITPVFVEVEYRLPYFPDDQYGFTEQERLQYAHRARKYLVNDADIAYLGELQFDDGSSLFNARELRHMVDVKDLLGLAFTVLWGAVIVLLISGVWKGRRGQMSEFWRAVSRGGWLTVLFLAFVLVLSVLNFRSFFVVFHRMFFEGDSWLFRTSDTLIRLFPIRFWQDAFIIFGLLAGGGGLALGFLGRKLSREAD